MNKTTKLLAMLAACLLMLNVVRALPSFDVNVKPIKDKIFANEIAEFEISIKNNLETNEEFRLNKGGYPFWDMYTQPLENPIIVEVPAKGSKSLRLFVDPLYITNIDTYTVEFGVVLERLEEEQKIPITIGIKSAVGVTESYTPTVITQVSIIPENINPREEFEVRISLNNQNLLDYPNLSIKVGSGVFRDEIYSPLGPKEEKTLLIKKSIDALTPPQKDRMTVAIFKDGKVIVNPIIKEFKIAEYVLRDDLDLGTSFLRTEKGIRITSNNPDYKPVLEIETTWLKNLFTSTNPRADSVKKNGKYYLAWRLSLDEDKRVTVYITQNYRHIIVIIALAAVCLLLYFILRSPIVLRKSVEEISVSHGGICEAKAVIRIKNRSSRQISSVEILDRLPRLMNVEKELAVGSMQPNAILQHPDKGFMIKWDIYNIEPSDERVLSYRIKSKLPILGKFHLPPASARLKVKKRIVVSKSNRVKVGN